MIFRTLTREHDRLREYFEELLEEGVSHPRAGELVKKLKIELTSHSKGEEEVVYPLLSSREKFKNEVREGIEEHRLSLLLLRELVALPVCSSEWQAKLKALKDVTIHHLVEEEQEIFEEAGKEFSSEELQRTNERYIGFKKMIAEQFAAAENIPVQFTTPEEAHRLHKEAEADSQRAGR